MEELSDEVSESPNYEVVVVGEDIKWPDGCCVCLEQPVTPVSIGLSTSQWLGTTTREAEATLRLPFCEVHLGRAEKHVRGDLLMIGGPTVIGVRLQFRNPKFARRFRELNPLVHLKISDGVAIKMQ